MSIVGAAFFPHSPLLLPTAAPAQARSVHKLKQACEATTRWIHAMQPDIILCFNPHAQSLGNAFTFNLMSNGQARFDSFGDLTTVVHVQGASGEAYRLKESLEPLYPVAANHEIALNYGLGIPALFCQAMPQPPRWIEISARRASCEEHHRFGVSLQGALQNARPRYLILASGEVCRGKNDEAKTFHAAWAKAIRAGNFEHFIRRLPTEQVHALHSCGALSAAQLLGTLTSKRITNDVLYDATHIDVAYQLLTWQLQ